MKTAQKKIKKTKKKLKKVVTKRRSADEVRKSLKLKNFELQNKLKEAHPKVDAVLKEKGVDAKNLRRHSAKVIGAGVVGGSLMLANPVIDTDKVIVENPNKLVLSASAEKSIKGKQVVVDTFKSLLPEKTRPLYRNEEKLLEQVFENVIGVKTRASLEGEHLNTTYGRIGAEQHLLRFPGDTVDQHKSEVDERVLRSGLAPGKGAWGYFANSKNELTPDLVEKEKWYAVVQTLYLPDWNTRQPHLKNWYKHRKVLMINTENGNAVIAAIADSGPAAWTGKHFGGSPEVMNHLGGIRYRKGPVVVFFVDDPENTVPLGPVEY